MARELAGMRLVSTKSLESDLRADQVGEALVPGGCPGSKVFLQQLYLKGDIEMKSVSRLKRLMLGLALGAFTFGGLGGSCLPDDFWVNKSGEIVNGVIVGALDGLIIEPFLGFSIR
jgi:hypothetical protein